MPRYEGVWTLTQQGQAKGAGNWPGAPTEAPTIGTATAGNTSASVAFTGISDPAVTQYRATSTPGGITATSATSPINVTGLTNGTAYTFTVAAGNALGFGPESAASNSVVPINPTAPWTLTTSPTLIDQTSNISLFTNYYNQWSDIQIQGNGEKLMVWNHDIGELRAYNLSTPYSLTSLSQYDAAAVGSTTTGTFWRPNGTRLFTINGQLLRLNTYNTAAFYPSTISFVGTFTGLSAQFSEVTGVYISDDGTKCFMCGNSKVAYYSMGTAWDSSTMSYQDQLGFGGITVIKVFFKTDGTRMFVSVLNGSQYEIRQYNLSTAWLLSSATLQTTFVTTSTNNSGLSGLCFSANGENMYTGAVVANTAVRRWNTNA